MPKEIPGVLSWNWRVVQESRIKQFSTTLGAEMKMTHQQIRDKAGYTLIEILIAMAVSGVVLAGIYQAYMNQMRINNTQNQVVDMQQNIRVAVNFMEKEIRIAGLDPSGLADSGIDIATSDSITLSVDTTGGEADGRDNNRDGNIDEPGEWFDGVPEQVTYSLSNDADNTGVNDEVEGTNNLPCHLLRNGQRLASNIDALNFSYLGVDESAGSVCTGERCPLTYAYVATVQGRRNIRAVQITIIARSGTNVPGLSVPFTDDNVYMNLQGDIVLNPSPLLNPENDRFRRIRLISEVRSRNIGLL
jgi:type IV pilus assembly protein PilW